MANPLMYVVLMDDGTLQYLDAKTRKPIDPSTGPGLSMEDKRIANTYTLNIIISSNPCGWVQCGNWWYWVCT